MDVLWLKLNMWEAFLQYAPLHAPFSYKQHFYKQRQDEIGKRSSKCWATPWGWTFDIRKLVAFFIHVII